MFNHEFRLDWMARLMKERHRKKAMQARFTVLVLFTSMVGCLSEGAGSEGLLVSSAKAKEWLLG